MKPIRLYFKNEYNSPIEIEVYEAEPHRHVSIEIRNYKNRHSWDMTEQEARQLSNALIEYLAQSPYKDSK